MGLVRESSGRLHIETQFMAESLMDKRLLAGTETEQVFRPLPRLNVIKLGGQSIIDRGRKALLPILDEIVRLRPDHEMLVMTGGGTRSRHVYSIALDLGMPTGVLAKLGSSISEQNALMVCLLLAPYKGIQVGHDDMVKLPSYMALGAIPVMHAMPPYGLWEEPAESGRIPPHRTDAGAYLTAEVAGAKRCILVKDERGLFTADPKKHPDAEFIPEIEGSKLLALARSDSVHEVFMINGLEPGNLTKVLNGENPGTRIYRKVERLDHEGAKATKDAKHEGR